MTFDGTITPERPQYLVYFDAPDAPGKYSVRFFDGSRVAGVLLATSDDLSEVQHRIPPTHERAPYEQPAPIVEVWILRPGVKVTKPERYPRGWHPDRDY